MGRWKGVPYLDNGTTRRGIGNEQFVQAVLKAALGVAVPADLGAQLKIGKLVERKALAPGDLVFFEGKGIGSMRPRLVGVFLGHGEFAIAHKDTGVAVAKLASAKWTGSFKTGRRVAAPGAARPTFDAAAYGENRAQLLQDIAAAWSGTLYKENGTTFNGIGNDEFVREVYEAIYETELEGTAKTWATLGRSVARRSLEPGDLVFYEAGGFAGLFKQQHVGLFIGNGQFVHAMKGSAVTVSRLADQKWQDAFVSARRLDPVVLARLADEREAAAARRTAARATGAARVASPAPNLATPGPAPSRTEGAVAGSGALTPGEGRLREAVEPWRGTPYKLGGTTKLGVDCSAFVQAVFDEVYRMDLPRTAEMQEGLGARIDRRELRTGDLVFFRTQGMGPLFRSRHVGVYLGNGEFAHASGSQGVTVSRLDNRYWNKKYAGARRLAVAH